jgi:hypothetical protein
LIHKPERPNNHLRGCSRHPQQRQRDTGQGSKNSPGEKTGLVDEAFAMKRKTNFDQSLEEQLKDVVPPFYGKSGVLAGSKGKRGAYPKFCRLAQRSLRNRKMVYPG